MYGHANENCLVESHWDDGSQRSARGAFEMPSVMADLMTLIKHEIPEGRRNIQGSHTNLEKVAEYCEANYFQAENKHAALEETKNYTTQSLASVAYQINTLAYNLLHMLDLQTAQLSEMESQINHIAQTVMIHKEKVARREIGILTTNKSTSRQHKILAPANQERPIKYIRRPIDYTVLDDVGHGLKSSNSTTPRARRIPSQVINAGPAPTTKPPTPPQATRGPVGSLTRSSREYRTPAPPIAPPQVPSNYAANYPLGHPRRGSGYSTLPAHGHHGSHGTHTMHPSQMTPPPSLASQPQVGMVHPMTQHHHHHHLSHVHSANIGPPSPTPPPPPPPVADMGPVGPSGDHLPEPPPHLMGMDYDRSGNVSPPLPPPPPVDESMYPGNYVPPSPPAFVHHRADDEPDWVPKNYLEKVVAIYDYAADKDDELSFTESSVIYVVKKNDDGWYEGVMNGITGLFPGNYVEPLM